MATVTTTAPTAPVARTNEQEPEWLVWATVALAVIIGLVLQFMVTGQTRTATVGDTNMSVSYPADWVQTDEPGAQFAVADLRAGGPYGDRMSVRQVPKSDLLASGQIGGGQPDPAVDLQNAAANWVLQRQNDLSGYRSLNVSQVAGGVGGKPAVNIEYAYLRDPQFGGGGMPGLMHGIDTLVQSGDNFAIMSFAVESSRFKSQKSLYDKLLAGWRIP